MYIQKIKKDVLTKIRFAVEEAHILSKQNNTLKNLLIRR